MGERRALLDPEMYKISEEDSQDEEVLSAGALAGYAEDALKLGEEATTISSWNNNVPPPVLPPKGWGKGVEDNNNYDDDDNRYRPQASSSFSSAMHRFGAVANLKYKNLQGQPQVPHSNLKSSKFSHPVQDVEGDGVDWPDTSTNSDSCLSSDDRRNNKRRPWMYGDDLESVMNSNKFISRTYFGDEVRKRGDGSSFTYLDEEEEDNLHSLGHAQSLPLPPHHQYTQNHRRHFHKKSRRRSNTSIQHGHHNNYSESTSASDCSDESSDGSPCNDCRGPPRSALNSEREGEGRSESSSDAEDYEDESSYSESSFDEYDDVYDDEFENEYYEDIVKFLSDNEFEQSTNADGDLFLVEYPAEPDIPKNHQQAHKISVTSDELAPQIDLKEGAPNDRRNSSEGVHPSESLNTANVITPATSNEPKPSTSGTHFQKSGKGAKGKISRLLKRRKDEPSKVQKESNENAATTSGSSPSLQRQSDTGNTAVPSSSQIPAPPSQTASKSPLSSSALLSSIAKNKGRSSTKTSSDQQNSAQPEKVFRFKDEHGGETRSVFVDVPQSDGNGNLLGRRATLIESILGIIPGRFSTPALSSMGPLEQNADRIMVAGFVPDGVASRYRRIKIGDWLQSVDDIPVDHSNVDQVLSSRSMYGKRRTAFETEYLRLKLTLTRVAGCMVSLPTSKDDSAGDSIANSSHISTELKRSNVSPNVQSHVAILYISSSSGGQSSSNGGSSETDTTNPNSNDESTQPTNDSNESAPKPPEKSKDVVFCWPKETDSKIVKALAASQGMFSTLYRLLWDVTGSHPLVSRVQIDDCGVDVTYTSDDHGKSLLLVAVATCLSTYTINYKQPNQFDAATGAGNLSSPEASAGGEGKKKEKKIRWREPQVGNTSVTESTRILARLENILKYQFGSFGKAFKEDCVEKTSRLLINAISALNDLSEEFLFLQVPGNFLRFPNSIRSGIDDVLYSFETSDTIYCNPKIASRRSNSGDMPVFHCHGSCLMYKGFLVTSHLENELASSFHGWWKTQLGLWEGVKRNSLLERWKPVSRLALWQQTSLPRKNTFLSSESSESTIHRQSIGTTRAFSAMVGVGNFTLGFVLEHLTDGNGHAGPDPGWIRRAMATICRLYQSGLTRSFECWLEKQGDRHEFVDLSGISPPSKYHKQSGNSSNSTPSKNTPATQTLKKPGGTNSILKNADAAILPSPSCPIHSVGAASTTSSSSSGSSICSCPTSATSPSSSGPSSTMKSFIGSSSLTLGSSGVRSGIAAAQFPSTSSVSSGMDSITHGVCNEGGDSDGDETTTGSDASSFKWYEAAESGPNYANATSGNEVKSIRVTRGNLLFDYIQIEFGRGVMLSSKDVHEGWASVVRHNFRQSVTVIHGILHKAAKARSRLEERGEDKKWISKALAPISEHGILFNCQITEPRDLQKRKPRKREVNYWVVGRMYPEEREIYVCYEDAPLSQNIVELAYKIALNIHC